jgi:hypothetical protein
VRAWPKPTNVIRSSLGCIQFQVHEAEKVVSWLPMSNGYKTESISYQKPRCDAGRPDWQIAFQEWQDRKRLCIWVCESCAVEAGIVW